MLKTNIVMKEEIYTHRFLKIGGAVAMCGVGESARVVQGTEGARGHWARNL